MSKLTVRKIETAKGPARLVDQHGLYLRVSPRGAKMWIQRLTIRGRRTDNGIGHYPAMTLAEARTAAFERWKIAKAGGDPRVAGGTPAGPTFREAADAVIAMHAPGWRGTKSGQVWRSSLETYVHPVIGHLPVAEVTPGHVMAVIEPIWNEKRETAQRVKQRISAICRWAVAQGHRTDDPAGIVIDAALPRGDAKVQHLPALPYEEVAECIAKVRGNARASESTKLALEFLVLTAARSGEVRKATWDEIDLEGATWTVPAERMKANREHRVPLSKRALEVLAAAASLTDGSGLVFPGMRPGRSTWLSAGRGTPQRSSPTTPTRSPTGLNGRTGERLAALDAMAKQAAQECAPQEFSQPANGVWRWRSRAVDRPRGLGFSMVRS